MFSFSKHLNVPIVKSILCKLNACAKLSNGRLLSSLSVIRTYYSVKKCQFISPLFGTEFPVCKRFFPQILNCNRNFVAITNRKSEIENTLSSSCGLLNEFEAVKTKPQIRSVIKWCREKGKRKTIEEVIWRFKRLHWGIWIRPISGSKKKLWKKTARRKVRIQRHVFCNATQSRMLDKMVTPYWRQPKYYPDDPYKYYHNRTNFPFTPSEKKMFPDM